MRISRCLAFVFSLTFLAMTFGCGGGGGGSSDSGSSGTGTLSMSMTDAKPLLPAGVTNCFVTIDEVLVHKSGGAWESMPMAQTPYTIDLLEFTDGATTEFVPPVAIDSGSYTQVRLSVLRARLRFLGNPDNDVELTIPSENLKTDKNFDFDVAESAAVDITIDFDLSKSIVVTGTPGSPSYQMKPVLHIVETAEAATIEGFIANGNFGGSYVVISVLDSEGQEYTKLQVDLDDTGGAVDTPYSIYWLVPNQAYTVQINYNPGSDDDGNPDNGIQDGYDETVLVPPGSDQDYPNGNLLPGDIYRLDFPSAT